MHQLEGRVAGLYKALLCQMKSICPYYRNKGLVFLRGLVNLDYWYVDLKRVTDPKTLVKGIRPDISKSYASFIMYITVTENRVERKEGFN